MNKYTLPILIALFITVAHSCKKEEGQGGKATIEGKLYNNLYDPNGKFLKKEEARDVDVYIIYGNNIVYDDNNNTHSDGTYSFKYLRKGKYKLFAYSDCNSCPSGVEAKQLPALMAAVNKRIEECLTGKKMVANPVRVFIDNLKAVNSPYPEYSPLISADESVMMFTR